MEISEFAYLEMMSALTSALQTSQVKHKQFYIEQALKKLVGENVFWDIKDREEWEDGIPA